MSKPPSGPYMHYGEGRDEYAVVDIAAAAWNISHPDEKPKPHEFFCKSKDEAVALRNLMWSKGVPSKLLRRHRPAWTILESNEPGYEFPSR